MASINRKTFLAGVGVVLMNLRSPFAAAATGPTLKPTRLGQTIIWRGKKYTAIKSKGKLIWNKGVVVAKAKPKPSPKSTRYPAPGYAELDLGASDEVLEGDTKLFTSKHRISEGKGFFVSRQDGVLTAFDRVCSHEGCLVHIGVPQLICSCHISFFNRFTGAPEGGPATTSLRSYEIKEVAGRIILKDINI